ncbi:MAG: hypothetical protein AB7K09_17715 [Planctomycetota bacterium]
MEASEFAHSNSKLNTAESQTASNRPPARGGSQSEVAVGISFFDFKSRTENLREYLHDSWVLEHVRKSSELSLRAYADGATLEHHWGTVRQALVHYCNWHTCEAFYRALSGEGFSNEIHHQLSWSTRGLMWDALAAKGIFDLGDRRRRPVLYSHNLSFTLWRGIALRLDAQARQFGDWFLSERPGEPRHSLTVSADRYVHLAAFGCTVAAGWLGRPTSPQEAGGVTVLDSLAAAVKTPAEAPMVAAVLACCDWHCSRSGAREDDEFYDPPNQLMPFEILSALQLRKVVYGYTVPELDHPLLQSPLGNLPLLPQRVDNSMLEAVFMRLKHELPSLAVFLI